MKAKQNKPNTGPGAYIIKAHREPKQAPTKPKSILTKLEPGDGLNLGADGRCMVLEIKPGLICRVVCGALDSPVLVILESRYVPANWVEKRLGPDAVELWKEKFGDVADDGQLQNKVRVGGIKEKKQRPPQPKDESNGEAPRGKLGRADYKGFPITCVIRTFGKAGWTCDEVAEFLKSQGLQASPTTISIGVRRGQKGQKSVADFTPAFIASIRPPKKQMDLPLKPNKTRKK